MSERKFDAVSHTNQGAQTLPRQPIWWLWDGVLAEEAIGHPLLSFRKVGEHYS
jgi:hypothetical protein